MKQHSYKYITVLCFAVLLASCKVGPDYHKPETPLPAHWQVSEANGTIDQDWWKRFNDETLNGLIAKALAGNLDLKIADARIAQARASRSFAGADLTPSVSLDGSATREGNRLAFPSSPGLPFDLTKPFNIFQTGFDASWELDLFGGKRRAIESAGAELESSEASRDEARVSLLAEVARTYVDIRQYQKQLKIADDTVKLEKDTLKIARERFRAGTAPKIDATRAEAQLTQAQAQVPYYTSLLLQAEYSMDVLMGEQPGNAQKVIGDIKPIPVPSEKLLIAAPADVIANRPDIRMAERQLASATAQQGVATAKLFPDISLTGFLGFLSTSQNTLLTAAGKSWQMGANVAWPILDYARISANIHLADAKQQEAFAQYQKSVVSALSDVEKSVTAYVKEEEHRVLLDKAAADNRHAVDITRMRYKEGLTSFLDVLDADRTYYASESQAADAEGKASQDIIAIYKSLGGGWKDKPEAAKPAAK